ncbi:tetratricopeptide repeat protein, partial [Flammeovirga aprica]
MTNFLIIVTLLLNITFLGNDETLKNEAIDAFYKKKFDYSIKLFKELGHKTNDPNTRVFAESCLGHIYAKEKLDIHQGIYHLRRGESIISETGTEFNKNHLIIYNFLGTSYEKLGLIDSAEYYFKKGTRLYQKHKSKTVIKNSIINNHGLLFVRKQEYHLAKEIFDYFNLNTSNNDYTHLSNYLMINWIHRSPLCHPFHSYCAKNSHAIVP